MMMSRYLVIMLAISSALLLAARAEENIYEVLDSYNFPPGLVPRDVVKNFELNPENGEFVVDLKRPCSFKVHHFKVLYKTKITGLIEEEEIKNLVGVQVKILNVYWSTIKAIEVDDDGEEIEFSIGTTSAEFPIYDFYNIPECGCGFDCAHS